MPYKKNFVETNPHLVYSDETDMAYNGRYPLTLTVGEHGTATLGYIMDFAQEEPISPITEAPVGAFVFILLEPDPGYVPNVSVVAGGIAPVPVMENNGNGYFIMPRRPVAVTVEFGEII